MKPFWTDDNAERRFLAEHGAVGRMEGAEHVIEAGNPALLPPWPPEVARSAGDASEQNKYPPWPEVLLAPSPLRIEPVTLCAVCQTPVEKHGDAGWRHELGHAERGGCDTPWPEG